MILEQLNPHACRTYLIGDEGTDLVVLVDPVLEHVDEYLRLLEERGLRLDLAIDTHTHADHISGAAVLRDRTDCGYAMATGSPAPCANVRWEDGHEWRVGSVRAKVMYTPGHTSDSMSLILPGAILTGDALFLDDGGAGRDDLPGGDPGAHWESLQKLLRLSPDLVVHPAHEYRGRQPSSLAEQRERNPHLKPRSKSEFIQYVEDLKLGPAEWMKDVLQANYSCAQDPGAAWIPADLPACELKGTLEHTANDIQVDAIQIDELRELLATGDGPLLVDVREADELRGELGHLPGIRHIPIGVLAHRLSELEADRDRHTVTVCRSGSRAHTAAQIMAQAGFEHVRVMAGGMRAWREAGNPVASE